MQDVQTSLSCKINYWKKKEKKKTLSHNKNYSKNVVFFYQRVLETWKHFLKLNLKIIWNCEKKVNHDASQLSKKEKENSKQNENLLLVCSIDTWPWSHICWGHMVLIGQVCKWVQF